jgi:hypothetical protein
VEKHYLAYLTFMGPCIITNIPIYIQQDATLHSLFYLENCSTCFGWYLHPSSGAHTSVSTAFVICHTVTATGRHSRYMYSTHSCQLLIKLLYTQQIFGKQTQIFKKIRPMRAQLFSTDRQTDGRADGQTDRHDEANSRFSQFCEMRTPAVNKENKLNF